jgi:hypothetical protein
MAQDRRIEDGDRGCRLLFRRSILLAISKFISLWTQDRILVLFKACGIGIGGKKRLLRPWISAGELTRAVKKAP